MSIAFNARLAAPYFPDCPPEIKENWVKKTKEGREKAQQGSETAIQTPEDFDEKIAKPAKKGIASFISPEFVTRSGRTYDEIMDKTDDSLASARKDYPQRVKAGYETGKYEEKVEHGQKEYARKWCKFIGPLEGYKKGGIKGLSGLGVMALGGDPDITNFLQVRPEGSSLDPEGSRDENPEGLSEGKERIDTMQGTPCAVPVPKKLARFKTVLANRIVHWGSEIITSDYEERVIKRANQELNQLVNEYRRPDIAPFSPAKRSVVPTDVGSGDSSRNNRDSAPASHIDFIVVEIPDPAKPGQKVKCLGLDIQIAFK